MHTTLCSCRLWILASRVRRAAPVPAALMRKANILQHGSRHVCVVSVCCMAQGVRELFVAKGDTTAGVMAAAQKAKVSWHCLRSRHRGSLHCSRCDGAYRPVTSLCSLPCPVGV